MNSTARYDFNLVKIFMVDFQATKAPKYQELTQNKWNVWYVSNRCSVSKVLKWQTRWGILMCNLDGQWPMSTKIQTQRDSFASGCFILLVVVVGGGVCPGSYSLFSFFSLVSLLLSLLVCLFCIVPLCYTYCCCLWSWLFFISILGTPYW